VVVNAYDFVASRRFRNQAIAQTVEAFVLLKHHDVFAHAIRLM